MGIMLRKLDNASESGVDYNVRAFGSITSGYDSAFLDLTTGSPAKLLLITNTLNQDIMISLDGGATTSFRITGFQHTVIDLASNGLVYNGDLRVKYASAAPTSGNLTIKAFRELN